MIFKDRSVMFIALAPLVLNPIASTNTQAQAVADKMTCQQAINYYEKNGRISKYAHGRTVIPIYNGVPVSQRKKLKCSSSGIRFKTTDNPRCTVAYKCIPRSSR